ncbi:MAG: hypothetical protein QOD92_1911 [Acidimicrobiaceae bacterium]
MTSWDGLLVVCSGASWDGMASPPKEFALRLARVSPVLFVDPPRSFVSVRRQGQGPVSLARGVQLLDDRLARLTPVVQPGIDRMVLARVTEHSIKRQLRRAVRELGGAVDAVIVANQRDLLGACDERRRIVLATDDFVAGAELMGVRRSVIEAQQRRQARTADLVVCVTPQIADTWNALGARTVVLPNGCDAERFAGVDDVPYASDVTLPAPVVGFVGHISERIDITLLQAVAATGVSLLLVGPRQPVDGLDALLARPNVQWIDQRPLATMPSYLRWIDVGVTPYADNEFNRGSFPLKTLEYLAAGRRVVATGLPATHSLATPLVTIADTPDDFAAAVARELARPLTNDEMQERQAFAARHSWEARANELQDLLSKDPSR